MWDRRQRGVGPRQKKEEGIQHRDEKRQHGEGEGTQLSHAAQTPEASPRPCPPPFQLPSPQMPIVAPAPATGCPVGGVAENRGGDKTTLAVWVPRP